MCGLDPSLGPATRRLSHRGSKKRKVIDQGVNIKRNTDGISSQLLVRGEIVENRLQQERSKITSLFELLEHFKMPAIFWLASVMGPSMVYLCWLHKRNFGWNFLAMAMICFLLVNLLICLWELCLCYKHGLLRSEYAKRQKDEETRDVFVLLRNISLLEAISPSFWVYIWVDYTTWDPQYADIGSYGYVIDVGNGHSTLLPSILLLWWTLQPEPSARPEIVAFLGIIIYWQTLYGTLLYMYSFVMKGRYQASSFSHIICCVCIPNSIWIVFPILGLWNSWLLLDKGSHCVLQAGCSATTGS